MGKMTVDSEASQPDWYKDAIIYELHLKAFSDGNHDGIGDLIGLADKLDYLRDLGVTAIWLLPFFPSPLRDDGYDIADYRNIHPSYGSLRDFRRLVHEAHKRGIRVIIELVINHTSDKHPWFQRARTARPGSALRDFYVWSGTDEKYKGTRIIFLDTEKSNWTWDPVASAFYWHRFFSHQPDLNYDNPLVVRAILNVMRFWLDFGVDGFRLDAVPYLCEREGTTNENLPETHAAIRHLRAELDREYKDRIFLAEANQWPEDVKEYFGNGDECHMAYHFPLMPRMYMAIGQEDRHPITDIMRQTPEIPETCQWAIFLRNHDELTLEMVTDEERDYLWSTYAVDRRARLNLGIRRRLAPLMDNDRRKMELMNSLLFSMPGTPIIYYGDEIGMGDNVYLGDRNGVRTPMQWTPDRNGGFSRADPASLYLPPIMDAVYGYQAVNVEAQSRSLPSLLNWMKRLIGVRQSLKVFGHGSLTFLYPSNRTVVAYLRQYDNTNILCVANLSRSAQAVQLELPGFLGYVPVEMLGQTVFPPITDSVYVITLQGYGFYWFQLTQDIAAPRVTPTRPPDLVTLVHQNRFAGVFEGRNRGLLEADVLPQYLRDRRWFGQKHLRRFQTDVVTATPVTLAGRDWYWLLVQVKAGAETAVYSLPLSDGWSVGVSPTPGMVLAKLRRWATEGFLLDALQDEEFIIAAVEAVRNDTKIESADSCVEFTPAPALAALPMPEKMAVRMGGQEQSNTSAIIEDTLIVKFYRRVAPGIHPEIEMSAFLTERAGFANTPAYLGNIHLTGQDGQEIALAVLYRLIRNQGDAWAYTTAYLDRFLQETRIAPSGEETAPADAHSAYHVVVEAMALRTAQLHCALYEKPGGNPAFTAEAVTPDILEAWMAGTERHVREAFALLAGAKDLPTEAAEIAAALIAKEAVLVERIHSLVPGHKGILMARHHGDYHLGQILIDQTDAYIVDFEGAPQIPLADRRRKHSVVRDVAGMLRSIDYAAWSALDHATASQPDRRNELMQPIMSWREETSRHFLDSYISAMTDCPLWPKDTAIAQGLLALFLIEKAAMEILYELANRPGWVTVPLRGIEALLAQ